ncbi:Protein TIC 20-I, chloroplastic [Ancistrocladus abbreviatus]
MALHEAWFYAEMAYSPHPFQESFEALTHPFLQAVGRLPSWFQMISFTVAYLGIVKRKEWPHFFRFHVILGMLTEVSLQVIGTASGLTPLNIFWGNFGMYYWIAVAFVFLVLGLECIRCALAGMYPDIPFLCEAAYIHTNAD